MLDVMCPIIQEGESASQELLDTILINIIEPQKVLTKLINVAKYHLGKVKLERVGQRSSSTSVCDLQGGPRGIAGLLVYPFC